MPSGLLLLGELLTLLFLAGVAKAALITGVAYVLFPELGALAYDVFTRPAGVWARAPLMLVATPAATAIVGTVIARNLPFGLASVALCVASALLLIRLLRSPIAPALSAGFLPIALGVTSAWYPVSIVGVTGLLALGVVAYQRALRWLDAPRAGEYADECAGERANECADKRADECANERVDARTDECANKRTNERAAAHTHERADSCPLRPPRTCARTNARVGSHTGSRAENGQRDENGKNARNDRNSVDDALERPPRHGAWVPVFAGFLLLAYALAAMTGLRLILFPPLVVIAFEMFAHANVCPWAGRALTLPLACTLVAAAGVGALLWLGPGPGSAGIALLAGMVALRTLRLHLPPALAIGLLPQVIAHASGSFVLAVAIGTSALTLVFLLTRPLLLRQTAR